ncbi:hypothetical protein CTAYLR_001135 [Chrysophaeum taylorii]|uniref:Uncharacterized protein n=1 Tax=Chrysophaeum taylorii TaxID=2483200 RepID=A0AAD7XUQ0_9STRA|nr:hypothetical protein CTAYLR_001135 [Chrysophaeum taylorii]
MRRILLLIASVAAFSVPPPSVCKPVRTQPLNAVIPGDSVAELVVLGGTVNFIGIYNLVLTARILLSWFPQTMGVPLLQPIFIVTEPFLGLFRNFFGSLLTFGGLDFSLIPAFFLLQAAGNSVAALGADISLLQ